ncbi:hypothetical protein JZ785_13995 [Alicyclobacillus curvatus]|nr:hypothetical protein JZ785_13995 [Alicyclobacillus curvatus]
MEWSELRDKFDPLNQHVSLSVDRKERIRERLHAEINRVVDEPKTVVNHRRHRRAVTAGSVSAALVAVLCIAAVIDYSGQNHAAGNGPFQWIHKFAPHGAAGGTSASSTTSSGATSAPAKGSATDGPASSTMQSAQNSGEVSNGLAQMPLPGVQLTADSPVQMFGIYGWMWTTSGLFHTKDGGAHWTKLTLPVAGKPYSEAVTVLNAASVQVALGIAAHTHASIQVLRSTDGGNSWQASSINEDLPGQKSGQVPAAMTFASAMNGWMTTNVPQFGMGGTSPGGLYRTTNGAQSWQRVQSVGFPAGWVPFEWITFPTPQIGFTVAAPSANADAGVTNGQYRLYRSVDGGVHWSQTTLSLPSATRVNILAPRFSSSTGYLEAVVERQNATSLLLFKSTDMGATWQQVYSFPGTSGTSAVLSANPQAVWVYWNGKLWMSGDGGGSFTNAPSVPAGVTELDMMNAANGYAVTTVPLSGTAGETHVLYETKDGGHTWTKVSTLP